MKEYFGIDFGTTNSAVVGRLRRNVSQYHDGARQPYPSMVAVSKTTGQLEAVGRDAWSRRAELSEYCEILFSAKMQLGSAISWRIGPEIWTPERVVTEVFKGLRKRVSESGGDQLLEAVVAIPVGFSPVRRKSLRKAADDAGITIKGFVSEPTAAVFKSFDRLKQWPKVVVFDWGGGTLDVSVLEICDDTVHEIATVPKPLGGDDLDLVIAEWAHAQVLKSSCGHDVSFESMESRYRDMMIAQCEMAKRMFSDEDSWFISIPRYGEFGTVNIQITYDTFCSLMKPQINEAIATLEEGVNSRAKLSFDQIGCILMVGGSSKLRGLRETMDFHGWSCEIVIPEDSDWHVADGAALLSEDFGDYVSSQGIGLKLCDETVFPLLTTGEKVGGTEKSTTTFGLTEDSTNARFVFVESKSDEDGRLTKMDRVLGHLSVPAFGFSNEPLRLESFVDEDLLFHASAKSDKAGEDDRRTWTYPELRFSYKLPIHE